MLSTKTIKMLSVATLISLSTFAGNHYSKTYADDVTTASTVSTSVKTIETKLADADKEAETIYQQMEKIQKEIKTIQETKLTPKVNNLTCKINSLDEKHRSLLEKFYNNLGSKRWNTEEEALALVSKTSFNQKEKKKLSQYIKKHYQLQNQLDSKYLSFEQLTKSHQKELVQLTAKAEAIYEKHGITKEILTTYYTQKGMQAD